MKKMLKCTLAIFLAILMTFSITMATGAAPPSTMDRITVDGQRFVDQYGRTRIFHGINMVGKWSTERYMDVLLRDNPDYFAKMQTMGFNVLRLGVTWALLEPKPGIYNTKLMDKVGLVFDRAAEYGIYVFLDMHQDVWGGEPDWATLPDETGGNKINDYLYGIAGNLLGWSAAYLFDTDTLAAFEHFWNNDQVNGKGLQDYYADLWKELARRYGDKPALLGYDFMNEPGMGEISSWIAICKIVSLAFALPFLPVQAIQTLINYTNGDAWHYFDAVDRNVLRPVAYGGLLSQTIFDRTKYLPFMDKMTASVREATPNGISMMESTFMSNVGAPFFGRAPQVNGKPEAQSAYVPHAYDLGVDSTLYNFSKVDRPVYFFENIRRNQQRMNLPVLVGEWGAGYNLDTNLNPNAFDPIDILQDQFDSYGWSNTYWTNDETHLFTDPTMPRLVRPYPTAINGSDCQYKFDRAANTFTLTYKQGEAADPAQPTVIYLPTGYASLEAKGLTVTEEMLDDTARLLKLTGEAGTHQVTVKF
jgi:endoglycosylceramidase